MSPDPLGAEYSGRVESRFVPRSIGGDPPGNSISESSGNPSRNPVEILSDSFLLIAGTARPTLRNPFRKPVFEMDIVELPSASSAPGILFSPTATSRSREVRPGARNALDFISVPLRAACPPWGFPVPIRRPGGAKSRMVLCPSLFQVSGTGSVAAGTPSRARRVSRRGAIAPLPKSPSRGFQK